MAISSISTSIRNAMCDAAVDAIDVGSTNTGGQLRIYTAGHTTLLATLEFSATAFLAAASGVATANSIASDTNAAATGTAAACRVVNQDEVTCWDGSVGTSGEDVNLSSVSITAGDTITISSMTVTQPSS